MGMAASQARYLGLTARKTNVEYEGQQINQARTALANQSANLFNRLLGLAVPTAPKTTDYTKQQYSFSDGYNDYEIDNLENVDKEFNGEKYNYQVTYHYNQEVFKAIQERNTNPQVQKILNVQTATEKDATVTKNPDSYTVTDTKGKSAEFKECTQDDLNNLKALESKGLITIDDIKNFYKTTFDEGTKNEVSVYTKKEDLDKIEQSAGQKGDLNAYGIAKNDYAYKLGNSDAVRYSSVSNDKEIKAAMDQIRYDYPELASLSDDEIWMYAKNGKTCFATEKDLLNCLTSGNTNQVENKYQISSPIDYQTGLNQYYATNLKEKITEKKYARLDDFSGSGRYQSIKIDGINGIFQLNSEEKTDQAAYSDAMEHYNYKITEYEKELADINAKTSIIQVQDRTLELRLKQLDTEQKALTTEMEAVKGVIQKNVETTFKTFSS